MAASPICTVKDGAGAPVSTTNGVNVTAGNTITITLVSSAGVSSWSITCIGTDELQVAATINAGLTVDGVNKTATFTMPASSALGFRSTVTDANGVTTSTQFGIYALVSSLRVGFVGETTEGSSAFGYTATLNAKIRQAAGSGTSPSLVIPAFSIDWSAATSFSKTLAAGANTFTFANATDGQSINVAVTGAASTLVWPTVKWAGGVVPTQTASGTDVYTFTKIGSTIFGAVQQAMASGPAPVLVSIAPTSGAPTTAVALTLTGTGFVTGCTVTVGGSAATSVVFGSSTSVTCNTPNSLAAGTYDVVITNPDGQSSTLVGGYTASSVFNPATLSLTGWWRGNYVSGTWTGTASAGSSGGRTLTAGTLPATGAAQNGITPAQFDGASTFLTSTYTLGTLFTASAGTLIILAKPTVAAANVAGAQSNPGFARCGSFLNMGYSNSGLRVGLYDGAFKTPAAVAATVSNWHMFAMKWDGASVYASVDGGAWVSVAAGAIATLTSVFEIGISGTPDYLTGFEMEVMTAPSVLADATIFTNIKSYFNSRYALAL